MRYILPRLLLIAVFTALLVKAAYIERGYFAIGIEWVLIPTILGIKVGICTE